MQALVEGFKRELSGEPSGAHAGPVPHGAPAGAETRAAHRKPPQMDNELRKREKRLAARVEQVCSLGLPWRARCRLPCPVRRAMRRARRRTLTAWRHCRAQTAQSLDAVAVKVDKESSKNEREIDTIIAAMLKGKGEREAMSRAHLAECAALNENLQGLLDKVMEKRRSSMPALSDSVEQRVAEVRTAVLAEVEALKSRPGAAAPHLLPGLLLCMAGGQASESDQRHLACHGEQAACQA